MGRVEFVGILDEALDGALEGARSVGAVVAGFEDGLARGGREVDGDLAVGEQLVQVGEAEIKLVMLPAKLVERRGWKVHFSRRENKGSPDAQPPRIS